MDLAGDADSLRFGALVTFVVIQLVALGGIFHKASMMHPKAADVALCFQINRLYRSRTVSRLRALNAIAVSSFIVVGLASGIVHISKNFNLAVSVSDELSTIVEGQFVSWAVGVYTVYCLHRPLVYHELEGVPFAAYRKVVREADVHELSWASLSVDAPSLVLSRWAAAHSTEYRERDAGTLQVSV